MPKGILQYFQITWLANNRFALRCLLCIAILQWGCDNRIYMEGLNVRNGQLPPFAAAETVCFERRGNDGHYFYVINGTPSRSVDFESLNGIYIKERSRSVYCCSLAMKSGEFQICRLIESDFWGLVEGKTFNVVVDESTRKVLTDGNLSPKEAVDRLFKGLDSGDETMLEKMTVTSPCYQLVEI